MKTMINKPIPRTLLLLLLSVILGLASRLRAESDPQNNFEKARSEILSHFVDPSITEDTLYQYALQGMLAGLNKKHPDWNRLYSPQEYQELQQDLSGHSGCIGTEITMDPKGDAVLILSVLPNSPAEKAGIKAKDKIIQIEGQTIKGMSLTQEEFQNYFAMKYTIATLTGPDGEVFDGVGITPDVIVSSEGSSLKDLRHLSDFSERLAKDQALKKAVTLLNRK